jgi:hypothetical protein
MESNQSYYTRRAAQEAMAASRAVTPTARAWHRHLADEFSRRANEAEPATASF